MPKAGEVHVRMTSECARAAAYWLAVVYIPSRRKPVTGLFGTRSSRDLQRIERLSAHLLKASLRRRKRNIFITNVDRAVVKDFCSAVEHGDLSLTTILSEAFARGDFEIRAATQLPGLVRQVADWMRQASLSNRGRPRLSPQDRKLRLEKTRGIDERHQKRLDRAQRIEDAWAEHFSNGGGLLGLFSLPKI